MQLRQQKFTSENVILIRELINKSTDGFFGEKYRIIVIADYPFINFQRELFNRLHKKISFTKEELMNFITSTIRGYANLEREGFRTDTVRLKNIFIGLKNRESVIKVAETNLLASKSNYVYMVEDGPHKP